MAVFVIYRKNKPHKVGKLLSVDATCITMRHHKALKIACKFNLWAIGLA